MSDFQIKYENPSPKNPPRKYCLKPFFRRGVNILTGRERVGKTSLCVSLAQSYIQCEPFWKSGPVAKKARPVVFVTSGPDDYFSIPHITGKLGNWEHPDIIFASKVYGDSTGKYPCRSEDFINIIKTHNPGLIFFDLFKHRKRLTSEFKRDLAKNNTALIGLFNGLTYDYRAKIEPQIGREMSKQVPHLQVKVRNNKRVLIKYSGFPDSPKDELMFTIQSNGQAFVARDIVYKGPEPGMSSIDKLTGFMAKTFQDRSAPPVALRELKDKARKAGVSSYVLNSIQWDSIGYKSFGQGYGKDYQKWVRPIDIQ